MFIEKGLQEGIRPMFDCGFPYCFFSEEQKEYLACHHVVFGSQCGVIPDVLPDLRAIPCFPLSAFSAPVNSSNWSDVRKNLQEKLKNMNYNDIYQQCKDCKHLMNGKCLGGCKAVRLKRIAKHF